MLAGRRRNGGFGVVGHGARESGARSVDFTPAVELTAEERAGHERYAKLALDRLEGSLPGPFAAVIVNRHTGEIVCEGVARYRDRPTFHGEIVAINACAQVTPPDLESPERLMSRGRGAMFSSW